MIDILKSLQMAEAIERRCRLEAEARVKNDTQTRVVCINAPPGWRPVIFKPNTGE